MSKSLPLKFLFFMMPMTSYTRRLN